jgi:hypothetical protein
MPFQTKHTASTTIATWERMKADKATKATESFMIDNKKNDGPGKIREQFL